MNKVILSMMLVLMAFGVFPATNPFCCLATSYYVEVVSVETGKIVGGTWESNYFYYRNEEMSVKVTLRNNEATTKTATIYVNAYDEINQPFGFYVEDVTFSAGETKDIYCPIYIPKWTISGAHCRATAIAVTLPEGAICPEKSDSFCILSGTPSYLTVRTFTTYLAQVYGIGVWVDGDPYLSPVTLSLIPGTHTVMAELKHYDTEGEVVYAYDFKEWEDGSTANPRTVNIVKSTNKTITAYYIKYRALQHTR